MGHILSSSVMQSEKENPSALSAGKRRKRGDLDLLQIKAHSSPTLSTTFSVNFLLSSWCQNTALVKDDWFPPARHLPIFEREGSRILVKLLAIV